MEKKNVFIAKTEEYEFHFVKLSDDQLRFLKWLKQNNLLYEGIDFDIVDTIKEI